MSELLNKIKTDRIAAIKAKDTDARRAFDCLLGKIDQDKKTAGETSDEQVRLAGKALIKSNKKFLAQVGLETLQSQESLKDIALYEGYFGKDLSQEELLVLLRDLKGKYDSNSAIMKELKNHEGVDMKTASELLRTM